jgi:SAM-dependent methyltransferase
MAYEALARSYDRLTDDVPYPELASFYEKLVKTEKKPEPRLLLDLCCGTGTLTDLLAARGYEMIGVDASPEMLSVAREKSETLDCRVKPMYLCQEASGLDLYGTVEGAVCCLDGMNYIPPEELFELFRRLHLFIEPDGAFAFDMHSPEHLHELDGQTFVDETEDMLCLWRAEFDGEENALFYGMDIFRRRGSLWSREEEEHIEFAHEPGQLCALLKQAGFKSAEIAADCPMSGQGRIFIRAENAPH